MKYYDKLIFELSRQGRVGYTLPRNNWEKSADEIPAMLCRSVEVELPQVSELDVVRHYTNLSNMNFGVDTGFYPLGSCTMKYNPRINEKISGFDGFAKIHPLQDKSTVKGCTELMDTLTDRLCEITGNFR